MMNASVGETYSNFWGGMDEQGYYKRVPEYFKMLEREVQGVFQVPMIHTVFLLDLRHTVTGNQFLLYSTLILLEPKLYLTLILLEPKLYLILILLEPKLYLTLILLEPNCT